MKKERKHMDNAMYERRINSRERKDVSIESFRSLQYDEDKVRVYVYGKDKIWMRCDGLLQY